MYKVQKKSQFLQEVEFINRTIKPKILILIETVINECKIEWIIKTLGYQNYDTILP